MPSTGVIWHGKECRMTRVRLNGDLRKTERLLREVKKIAGAESLPKLILNDHCQICEFRIRCHDKAVQEDNISLLRGMSEKEVKKYARRGIFSVTQLAHTFRPRRKGKKSSSIEEHHHHALQAQAIRDRKIYVLGSPQLPLGKVKVYLDVEGCPDDQLDYLVGILITEGDSVRHCSFWAKNSSEEDLIFEKFLDSVADLDDFLVFCYGSYEKAFLQRMRMRSHRKDLVDRVLKSVVNVLSLIYPHIYFPTYSNGLKEVASYLGSTWTDPNASGIQSITWRKQWEKTKEEEWKQKLVIYNLEDCKALKLVTEFIYDYCVEVPKSSGQHSNPDMGSLVERIKETDIRSESHKWGHTKFLNTDFTYINRVSQFDYQRDRVFVRTSRKVKKSRAGKHHNRTLPVSERLEVIPENCPQCKGEHLCVVPTDTRTNKLYTKRSFDLLITPGKIRRRVIECHGSNYRCQECGNHFLPPKYEKLDKHFHGLKSWLMYGHIENRYSFDSLRRLLKESFGLHVHEAEIHMIKGLLAHYYRGTYAGLLRRIVTGTVLHVDETQVKLRFGTDTCGCSELRGGRLHVPTQSGRRFSA